jgi:subtilisin family serine protease
MPISPQGPQSPLLGPPNAPSTPSGATGLDPRFYTGRVILAFPKGTLAAGIQALSNRSGVKPIRIASAGDFQTTNFSVSQVLQGSDALRFDELDTLIVNDPQQLQGLSPASLGSSPMPKISPERFLFFANAIPPSGAATSSPGDAKALMDGLDNLLHQFRSGTTPALRPSALTRAQTGAGSLTPAQTFQDSSTTTWGLQAVQAVTSSFTGKGVKVAIIDSGIDPTHPDFVNRAGGLVTSTFVNETINDIDGHGTHVAGTVGGLRNGTFNYGVAPNVELFIAKVMSHDALGRPTATDGAVMAAVRWAVQNQCQLANMSLSAAVSPGEAFPDAIDQMAQNALASGLLLVAAAGNDSGVPPSGPFVSRLNPPAPVGYPANCPHIVAVGALAQDLSVALYSNGGQSNSMNGQVDFAAPGDSVVSSWPLNVPAPFSNRPGYNIDSGTSMACPHVVGLAALMSEKLGGAGGLTLWQALALGSIMTLPGILTRDVGFGLPLAAQ